MRIPRNISGVELVALLRRNYGYTLVRQNGSHMQLVSYFMGYEGHVTVPHHNPVKVGTLIRTLNIVAAYLEIDRDELASQLFG